MIHNRTNFINNLQEKLGKSEQREPERNWSYSPQWKVLKHYSQDMLARVLKKQCKEIHTTFIESSRDDVGPLIRSLVEQKEGKKVIFPKDKRLEEYGILSSMAEWEGQYLVWDSDKGDENIHFAEQADFGIVVSDQTLAESGTCVLYCDENHARSISLLPHKFIAIIPKHSIVPRLTQATKEIHDAIENRKEIASCVNFVTGPSNSADIEMNLVVGVHGPVEATYVLVDE